MFDGTAALALTEEILESVEAGETASYLSLVTADSGATIAEVTTAEVVAGNGAAVTTAAVCEGGVTTGVGLFAALPEVAVGGIAIALGVGLGVGLYNLAPDFWTNVSDRLFDAGKTIGGKIVGFFTSDGQTGYDKETIEIVRDALIEAGVFDGAGHEKIINTPTQIENVGMYADYFDYPIIEGDSTFFITQETGRGYGIQEVHIDGDYRIADFGCVKDKYTLYRGNVVVSNVGGYFVEKISGAKRVLTEFVYAGMSFYAAYQKISGQNNPQYAGPANNNFNFTGEPNNNILQAYEYLIFSGSLEGNPYVEPDAVYPDGSPLEVNYPDWSKIEIPNLADIFEVNVPSEATNQENAQTSPVIDPAQDPNVNPQPLLNFLLDTVSLPNPNPDALPEEAVDPDPRPEVVVVPDAVPVPLPGIDPVNPNPEPVPSDGGVVVTPVNNYMSNKLYSIYHLSFQNLNDLGAFLWSGNVIEQLKRIWQEPLDGVISLHRFYLPLIVTSDTFSIKLGVIDTNVFAKKIVNQIAGVNCGEMLVNEEYKNATDYSPYTSAYVYLPFIGFQELNVDEIMNRYVSIEFNADVCTGSLIACIYVRNQGSQSRLLLYQFTGNCCEQIPLTSLNASGLIGSLLTATAFVAGGVAAGGAVSGGGAAIASSGSTAAGVANVANGVNATMNHQMIHIQRSGSFSGNSGIMGYKKPYIIIMRRRKFDSNGYNAFYGFPSNLKVKLANMKGYFRVKSSHLITSATRDEQIELENMLKNGVIR